MASLVALTQQQWKQRGWGGLLIIQNSKQTAFPKFMRLKVSQKFGWWHLELYNLERKYCLIITITGSQCSSSAVPCNVDQPSAMIGQSSYSNSSVPCNIDQPSGEQFLAVATFTHNPVVLPQIVHMAPLAKPYISPSLKATLSLKRIVSQRQYQKLEKAGRLASP